MTEGEPPKFGVIKGGKHPDFQEQQRREFQAAKDLADRLSPKNSQVREETLQAEGLFANVGVQFDINVPVFRTLVQLEADQSLAIKAQGRPDAEAMLSMGDEEGFKRELMHILDGAWGSRVQQTVELGTQFPVQHMGVVPEVGNLSQDDVTFLSNPELTFLAGVEGMAKVFRHPDIKKVFDKVLRDYFALAQNSIDARRRSSR